MKRNLTTLWMLLLMIIVGGGNVWGETYEWSHDGQKSTLTGVVAEKNSSSASTLTGYSLFYEGTTYISAVKMESATTITFTTTGTASITIGVLFKNGVNYSSNHANIRLDNVKSADLSTENISNYTSYSTYTYENKAAGSHTITRGDNEVGVFYIKVVTKSTPTLTFGTAAPSVQILNGNSSATYTNTLTNTGDGTVTYSLPNGDNMANATINSSTGQVTVTQVGTVKVVATSSETTNYNSATAEYTLTVTRETPNNSGPNYAVQSYPYTWNFNSTLTDDCVSSFRGYDDWVERGYNSKIFKHEYSGSYDAIGFNITPLHGLRFNNNGWLAADCAMHYLYVSRDRIITIPDLTAGQIVTFNGSRIDGEGDFYLTGTNTTPATVIQASGDYAFTVLSNGSITIQPSSTFHLNSIAVTNPVATNSFSIDVSKLMMISGVNANRNINRTIPCATLTFGGGDGIKFNETDKFILRGSGTFTVALRKGDATAKMLGMVLHGDFSKYTKSSITDNITVSSGTIVKTNNNTLTWTSAAGGADEVTFTNVDVSGVSVTISSMDVTTNGKTLDATKVTPSFGFSPSSASASTSASGSYTTTLNSTPGFFRGAVTLVDGGTGTIIKGEDYTIGTTQTVYTLTSGTSAGTATLTAQATTSDYFNASSASTYTLTIASGNAELTNFAFNKDEALYTGTGGSVYVNSKVLTNAGTSEDPFKFVYDASRTTLKTKFFLDPSLSTIGAAANSTYFGVTSADATILDVSNVSFSATDGGTRIYFDGIRVLKAGTTSLTFQFKGSDSYNARSVTVYFDVVAPITTYSGTYPFTWDFTSATSWESSRIQAAYHNSHWTTEGNAARLTSDTFVPDWNDIDKIKGLAFDPAGGDQQKFWLNWNDNKIFINGTMTVPSLSPDYMVRITAPAGKTITTGETTLTETSAGVYTYTPTTTGNITFTLNTDVYKVEVIQGAYTALYTPITSTQLAEGVAGTGDDVGKYLIDGKERNLKGKWEFTGAGSLQGGTVISDVPGITMTIGVEGDNNWTVTNCGTNESPVYAAFNPSGAAGRNIRKIDGGCFYRFTPYVNGYLTVNTRTGNIAGISPATSTGYMFVYEGITNVSGNINYQTGADYNITFPLIAGHVYDLCCQNSGFDLHSFTFRPAFLNPTTNTDQLSITDATYGNKFVARIGDPAKNAFPKLINPSSTEQQNKVKFASDKDKVYLYKNNDVEIIGNGENILVRGTVLDKNNEDGLVAYYYLNAYVLTVTSYELEDQEYIATNGLTDGKYQIEFSGNIQAVGSSVVVQIMKDNETVQNVTATITDKILYIPFDAAPFASLEEGATYRITIPENSIALTADAETKNSAIERTFSVNKADELQVKMIYPTNIATVGTTIVLATYLPDGSASNLNDKKKVKAILSASGESDMELSATFSGNQMAFKPTRTLSYNKEYTLTINYNADNNVITSLEVNSTIYKVTHSKVFKFTTGSSSGTSPVVTETSPVANAVIPGTAYSGGKISFTFNQAVELEPYSEVKVTPINGSEATTTGKTLAPDNAAKNTLVLSNGGKTVSFDYSADGLKYDVYYQVVIPANTVIGAGGLPNTSDITLNFKMGSKPTSEWKVATAFTGYPYSWDFSKFGVLTSSKTDLDANAPDDPTTGTSEEKNKKKTQATATRWQKTGTDEYANYWTNNMVFPQGEVFSYKTTKPSEAEVEIAEMRGLRWSLASRNSGGTLRRVNIKKSSDGYYLRMEGGTHYLTIPGLTAGQKIYIRAHVSGGNEASRFNINSDNAVFTDKYQAGNNKLGVKDNVTHVYPVSVTADGDVTFCLQDVSFYQIAVPVAEKSFNDYDGKSYTTECRTSTERYDLSNVLSGYEIIAKAPVSYTDNGNETGTLGMETVNVAEANTPVILCTSTGATAVPLFATDVNTPTTAVSGTNLLVGNTTNENMYVPKDSYIMTRSYVTIDSEGNPTTGTQLGPLAFYRVLADNSNYVAPNKAYLDLSSVSSGAKVCLFFLDAFEDDATGIGSSCVNSKDSEGDGFYYNLNGQKFLGKPTQRGIYIQNGKKVFVR